jgi:hypothetical protein
MVNKNARRLSASIARASAVAVAKDGGTSVAQSVSNATGNVGGTAVVDSSATAVSQGNGTAVAIDHSEAEAKNGSTAASVSSAEAVASGKHCICLSTKVQVVQQVQAYCVKQQDIQGMCMQYAMACGNLLEVPAFGVAYPLSCSAPSYHCKPMPNESFLVQTTKLVYQWCHLR